jgi:hypothetical protein
VDRRLSIGIATAALSLVVGLVLLLAGPTHDDTQEARVNAAVAELDARIRETSAGVQARAVTLSQLPRLGWAVSTDPTTVRDLTQDELAFRPLPGESIEIAQIQVNGGQSLTLLRAPSGGTLKLPVTETGQRLLIHEDHLYVAAVLAIHAHARAEEIRGSVAVAQRLELPAVVKQLESAGAHVRLETGEGAMTLGMGAPPHKARATVATLGSPAAQATKVTVLSPSAGGAGRRVAGVLVILLGLAVAGVAWMKTRTTARATFTTARPPFGTELHPSLNETRPATEAPPTPPLPTPIVAAKPVPPATALVGSPPPGPTAAPPATPASAPSPPLPNTPPPPLPNTPSGKPTLIGLTAPPVVPARPASDRRPTPLPPPPKPALPLPAGSRPAADRRPTPHVPVAAAEPDRRATPLVPLPTLEASGKHPMPEIKPAGAAAKPASKLLPEAEITATDEAAAPVAVIVDEVSTTLTSLNADLARVTDHDRSSLGAKGANSAPEFRALFKEFVELRRTCGEPTEGLDADKFVVVLGQKRAELMARHAYKDVRFWVGFNDGKAVIRSRGIR